MGDDQYGEFTTFLEDFTGLSFDDSPEDVPEDTDKMWKTYGVRKESGYVMVSRDGVSICILESVKDMLEEE